MRENVIRDIVTRLLTDTAFAEAVRTTPAKALKSYDLTDEEMSAVYDNDAITSSLGRLETRISASLIRNSAAGDDCCGCVKAGKCPPC